MRRLRLGGGGNGSKSGTAGGTGKVAPGRIEGMGNHNVDTGFKTRDFSKAV